MPNGYAYHLPWYLVKRRCVELGLQHVPELMDTFRYDGDVAKLDALVSELNVGPDPIDPSHIREGIVLRIDNSSGTHFIKAKSAEYYDLENKSKSDKDFVDIEEVQS